MRAPAAPRDWSVASRHFYSVAERHVEHLGDTKEVHPAEIGRE
jgi:hypothetical protein